MTNRELSTEIRKKLKEAGFTSKDYSIRVRDAGFSTSVDIRVKNPRVRLSDIEQITKRYESVEHDERTGEVLEGGNIYTFCQYENGIFDEVILPLMETSEKVFISSKWDGRKIAENELTEVRLVKVDEKEKELVMYDKQGACSRQEGRVILHSPDSLALAMWRFKNIGTIFV